MSPGAKRGAVLLCLTALPAGSAVLAAEVPSPFLTRPGTTPQEQSAALPPGEGRDEVEGICSACHSLRMVTQQRLSRHRWDELLDWMVAEQGMGELAPQTRERILDYLATNLSPPGSG